jgi:hypothetical protein
VNRNSLEPLPEFIREAVEAGRQRSYFAGHRGMASLLRELTEVSSR